MKDSFVFYRSFYEACKELDAEDFKAAVMAICAHALDGEEPDIKGVSKAVYVMAKPIIDVNNIRYENGKKGGRPKKNTVEQTTDGIEFRKSKEYKKWRQAVFEKCGSKCAMCGTDEGQLNAHHIKDIFNYPELRTEVSNGTVLCNKCHNQIHALNNQVKTKNEPNKTETEPYVYVYDNESVYVNNIRAREKKTGKKIPFNRFEQRTYDYEKLEKRLLGQG